MKRPLNNDGTPRKQRIDCKINSLPDAGKIAFAEEFQKNPASPNVERLQAICREHGVDWSAKGIYEFCRGPRSQEFTITAGVIRNRLLGQALVEAGADALHADARRLALGYWTTVARCAQELESPQREGETLADWQARLQRARAEMTQATDNLAKLGALKAGEDKGYIAVARLDLQREKQKLDREKFETELAEKLLDEAMLAKAAAIASSNAPRAEKIAALRQAYFADVDELEKSGKVVLPK
jgi:hypothetical protein